jgi:hypothetical protein
MDWEKRARELFGTNVSVGPEGMTGFLHGGESAARIALQLGREMVEEHNNSVWLVSAREELQRQAADARAEDIAKAIDGRAKHALCANHPYDEAMRCAELARSFISKPKSREAVLEEALRELNAEAVKRCHGYVGEIARRALEWKP